MRVITWNLNGAQRVGRATRDQQHRAWNVLGGLEADVLLLQEVEPAFVPSFCGEQWQLYGLDSAWGSIVAVKSGRSSEALALADPWLDVVGNYVASAAIQFADRRVVVGSVHAPARKARELFRILGRHDAVDDSALATLERTKGTTWALDVIFEGLARSVGESFLVGGDFNESRLFDATMPNYSGASAAFFARARDRGWSECCCRDGEVRTFVSGGCAPYQLDHLFCDASLAGHVERVAVIDDERVRGVSDHLPVAMDLRE